MGVALAPSRKEIKRIRKRLNNKAKKKLAKKGEAQVDKDEISVESTYQMSLDMRRWQQKLPYETHCATTWNQAVQICIDLLSPPWEAAVVKWHKDNHTEPKAKETPFADARRRDVGVHVATGQPLEYN